MPSYKVTTQVVIVSATMALHNFIRRAGYKDYLADEMIVNPERMPYDDLNVDPQVARHGPALRDDIEMEIVQDNICAHIQSDQ